MGICRRQFGAYVLGALAGRAWAAPTRPKLTVWVVVEQLRPDALESAWPQLGPGGFRKLAEKAAWFPTCRHLSSTFSSTGIANLATGTWPAQHGIVADWWYDRAAHRAVKASDEGLLSTTLAAQVAGDETMRVAVVAMSRPHAALFAGTADAKLYTFDERCEFAASGAPPAWLKEFNTAKGPETARDMPWMAVNPAPDAPPLRTLHYHANHPQEFTALYQASPFGQTAVYEMAGELVMREKLGQGNINDLVCVIDESSALLGYETGAHNGLMQQMVLQLDRRIETLWNLLTRVVGENNFNLVVSAAHGIPPEPAAFARERMAVDSEALAQFVETSLKGSDYHVEKFIYPFLYLRASAHPEEAARMAAEAVLSQRAVEGYFTAWGQCSTSDEWRHRFENSFHLRRSGDLMVSYRPEYVEAFNKDRGVSYGSLYNYDAYVPLFFYGPQFRAGTFETPVDAVDVAPTLARAMGVADPSSSMGRVLSEALLP